MCWINPANFALDGTGQGNMFQLMNVSFGMKTSLAAALALMCLCAAPSLMNTQADSKPAIKTQIATFGGGCFWCLEAFYETFDGVKAVVSGYTGGHKLNPTYKEVCGGDTGHAEVVQIEFDPTKISYAQLLEIFWEIHDPTTLNRQGNDVGTQYRSAIYYHDEAQKKAIEQSLAAAKKKFDKAITTEVAALGKFYVAEEYHQDYFRRNPNAPYCAYVISPKLQKLQKLKKDGFPAKNP
jgi:peptide-methionine (S)-S-oxide reductase